jgi:hypothetical protein
MVSLFHWPNDFLLLTTVLAALSVIAPWVSAFARRPIVAFLLALTATGCWVAYEYYLEQIARIGDPLIRIDRWLGSACMFAPSPPA